MFSSYCKDTLVCPEGLVSDGSDRSDRSGGPGFSCGFCVSCESEADGLGGSRGSCVDRFSASLKSKWVGETD